MPAFRRLILITVSLLAAVAQLPAQETPTLTKSIPDLTFNGLGSNSIDLRQYFGAPDLTGSTIVQINTVLGPINLKLLSSDAPLTVQNFLNYVTTSAYANSMIHRSVPGFVIQGGGYTATVPTSAIAANATVQNEFKVLNTRGTIAMAKSPGNPNSATNQWFINLTNNTDLDDPANNGGYTAFGRVVGTGMTVADAIAALQRLDAGSPFDELPVRNYTGGDLTAANLVAVNSVAVIPLYATAAGQTSVISFSGSVDVENVIAGTFNGSSLELSTIGQTDGVVNITITATDSNGNHVSDEFKLTVSHIISAGSGTQVNFNTPHPNGNVYDQVLLTGTTATVTADSGQSTRLSFIDLNDDIVQLEFSGAGTLKVTLENATGPAVPAKYNQSVNYMKGHAVIEITGANETSNLLITSVGKLTAFDPTGAWHVELPPSDTNNPLNNGNGIFKAGESYDGIADVALVNIASTNGKFGGLYCAGAGFFRASGATGINAPGIEFTKRILIHDLNASGSAIPVLITGAVGTSEAAGSDFNGKINIAGGDLNQSNGAAVQIGGATKLKSRANYNSHYVFLPAQNLAAQVTRDGVDVTAQVVENP